MCLPAACSTARTERAGRSRCILEWIMLADCRTLAVLAVVAAVSAGAQDDSRYRLLTPIPDRGGVPPIVEIAARPAAEELDFRRRSRAYASRIRRIRYEYLGDMRAREFRDRGIDELRAFTDAAALEPLIEELAAEKDDVRLAMLEHFAALGDDGQGALAWIAIHDPSEAYRHEAMRRMVSPASPTVLRVLDSGIRSTRHAVANHAGTLAGSLRVLEAIPLLIFAQATQDPFDEPGDLAWIAVATQRAFVAGIEPIVGSGAGAFRPIPGIVQEGAILRIVDAVVIFYRTEIHRVLVMMTTDDWGQSTAHLGYDMNAWWHWYNDQYVPDRNARAALGDP